MFSIARICAEVKIRDNEVVCFCQECVGTRRPRSPEPLQLSKATDVHDVWKLDNQEAIYLRHGEAVTICRNVRDPIGAAMISRRAFSVKTTQHWRKLTSTETRQRLAAAVA